MSEQEPQGCPKCGCVEVTTGLYLRCRKCGWVIEESPTDMRTVDMGPVDGDGREVEA